MAVSTRTRFEVFKRDGFTCQYCGRNRDGDGVKLHVDHVIPCKEGGGDELENLVTACQDCNLGKAAKLLDERAPVADIDEQIEAMRARRAKLQTYAAEKQYEKALRDHEFATAWNYWFEAWDAESLAKFHCPWQNVVRGYVDKIGVDEVKDAMDITVRKFEWISAGAVRYFNGVCKRKVADSEGRLVECDECGGRMVITREQRADYPDWDSWIHASCRDERDAKRAEEQADDEEREAEELEDFGHEPDEIDLEIKAWDELAEAAGA